MIRMWTISKRIALAVLIAVVATCALARSEGLYNPKSNSVGDYQGIDSNSSSGGTPAPTLDGSAKSTQGSTNTNTVTLSTTNTNDEVIVYVSVNNCTGGTDSIAVTSSHLTFTQRKSNGAAGCSGNDFFEYSAPAASVVTSEVITATISPGASVNYMELIAFGVHGINTASPFDTNASIPSFVGSGNLTISTNHASDFIAVGTRNSSAPTTDSGFTAIQTGAFIFSEYKQVTTTQSGLTANGGTNNGAISDAIVSP